MNRMLTALALSGLFVAAPAFAKTTHQGRRPAAVAKSAAGEGTTTKPTKTKKAKHVKKAKKAEAAPAEAPAEPPAGETEQ
jgi:hypothetical protein